MAKASVTDLSEEAAPFQRWPDVPYIPATDNEPGAPEAPSKGEQKSSVAVDGPRLMIVRDMK